MKITHLNLELPGRFPRSIHGPVGVSFTPVFLVKGQSGVRWRIPITSFWGLRSWWAFFGGWREGLAGTVDGSTCCTMGIYCYKLNIYISHHRKKRASLHQWHQYATIALHMANLADIHPEIIRKPQLSRESYPPWNIHSKFAPENRPNPERISDRPPTMPFSGATPPKFNSSPLKNDAWKMSFLLGPCLFLGANC